MTTALALETSTYEYEFFFEEEFPQEELDKMIHEAYSEASLLISGNAPTLADVGKMMEDWFIYVLYRRAICIGDVSDGGDPKDFQKEAIEAEGCEEAEDSFMSRMADQLSNSGWIYYDLGLGEDFIEDVRILLETNHLFFFDTLKTTENIESKEVGCHIFSREYKSELNPTHMPICEVW